MSTNETFADWDDMDGCWEGGGKGGEQLWAHLLLYLNLSIFSHLGPGTDPILYQYRSGRLTYPIIVPPLGQMGLYFRRASHHGPRSGHSTPCDEFLVKERWESYGRLKYVYKLLSSVTKLLGKYGLWTRTQTNNLRATQFLVEGLGWVAFL